MNAKRDLILVIFLVVALGVAWYYTGGTANDLARSGPFFSLPQSGGTRAPAYSVPGVARKPAPGTSQEEEKPTIISNYLGTFTEEKSPYAQYVTLEESSARSTVPNEYLTIRVNSNFKERITITGWRIESTATGFSASLPQAAELPFLGSVNSPGPVSVTGGQTIYVITGRSPNGTSFRTNICTGYFEQYQNFQPSLKLECPLPETEAQTYFVTGDYNDACYDIVRTLGRCTFTVKSVPGIAGPRCEKFVHEELSYNGCINTHKNDPKFYKNTWYLYLNRDQELWRTRSERIRLLDENGKVVDVVSY